METFIKLALSNFTVTLTILWLFCSVLALLISRNRSKRSVSRIFFSYYLLICIGISNIYNFVMHVFYSDMVAGFIGWANSPFQIEVGVASLGIGIAGLIAFRADIGFRAATIIPPAVFSWGAAAGHIYQIVQAGNFAPGNAGMVLWSDIFLPFIGFFLLWQEHRNSRFPV